MTEPVFSGVAMRTGLAKRSGPQAAARRGRPAAVTAGLVIALTLTLAPAGALAVTPARGAPALRASVATTPAASWSAVEVASPPTTYVEPSAGLFAVTCTGAGTCIAGGEYINSARHQQAMIASGARGTWSGARPLALPHTSYARFGAGLIDGLTCTSPGNCLAVGYLGTQLGAAGDGQGFIDTEVTGTWRHAFVPAEPAGASARQYGELVSVACSGPGSCTAVGFYTSRSLGSYPTAVTEAGGRWRATAISLPANAATPAASIAGLSSVQCPLAGACVAVGRYRLKNGGGFAAMRVTETGGSWGQAVQIPPAGNASIRGAAGLASISCATSTSCLAVGSYVARDGHSVPMAVTLSGSRWSGPKAIGSLPATAAANAQPGLYAVSCEVAFCQAIGGYLAATGSRLWMAIREAGGHWGPAQPMTEPPNAAGGPAQEGYPYALSCTASNWCTAVGIYIPDTGAAQPLAATRS